MFCRGVKHLFFCLKNLIRGWTSVWGFLYIYYLVLYIYYIVLVLYILYIFSFSICFSYVFHMSNICFTYLLHIFYISFHCFYYRRTLVCLWVHIRENNGLHNTDRFQSVSPKILVLNRLNRCNFKVDIIPNMCFRGG